MAVIGVGAENSIDEVTQYQMLAVMAHFFFSYS